MLEDKSSNKEIVTFHRLCKDLYKYIQRRVIKKYVNPQFIYSQIGYNSSSLNIGVEEEKEWKYYNIDESVSEEEKILDIFKDNTFLSQIQKCYESLEILITSLNENQRNIELLQKNIEVGEHKIKLLSQLNNQLNQFFKAKENNDSQVQPLIQEKNTNNITNNECENSKIVLERINLVKSLNILKDLQIFSSVKETNIDENNNNINNININNTSSANTTITNNNNIILDNKIINNNIGEHNKGKKTI